jgi:hypothetical protein
MAASSWPFLPLLLAMPSIHDGDRNLIVQPTSLSNGPRHPQRLAIAARLVREMSSSLGGQPPCPCMAAVVGNLGRPATAAVRRGALHAAAGSADLMKVAVAVCHARPRGHASERVTSWYPLSRLSSLEYSNCQSLLHY